MTETSQPISLKYLLLDQRLLRAIEALGYSELTEIQQLSIPAALEGKDILACAKTGSGKTAAFLLPILHRLLSIDAPNTATRALILVPTRELALQTQKGFEKLAQFTYLKSGLVIGGEAFKYQVAKLRKNPELLIATPGRLVEHLDKGSADLRDLECLVLDEADQMLKMGFSEDLTRIVDMANAKRQNYLFSATLKQKGMHRIQEWLQDPVQIDLDHTRHINDAISQQVIFADESKHKEKLTLAILEKSLRENPDGKIFIFCNTRSQCQQLGNFLKYKKFSAGIIHSEIAQSMRKQVMNNFRQSNTQILVATDVAARGLDIDNVDLVLNYSVSHTGDDHTHRVGRTGRAGKKGLAINLIEALEYNKFSSIERYLGFNAQRINIDGLEAKYQGPKKVKRSGKAAGSKTKKPNKKSPSNKAQKPKKKKPKHKAQAEKNTDKKMVTSGDGFGALRKKR